MITEATFVFYTVCLYSDSDFKSSYIARDFFKKGPYFIFPSPFKVDFKC